MQAISSMATRHVLADLATAAVAAGHPELSIESVGGVDAAERVAAGEPFDLVFLALGALQKLADAGHVRADSVTPLLVSQVAVAVPASADEVGVNPHRAACADAAELRAALRGAARIGYSTGPSGVALVQQIERWGLVDELSGRLLQAKPGIPVAQSIAEGAVDLGFQQLSELVGQRGVRILGVLPADCAIDTVFAGAVATRSVDPGGAQNVLAFLASGQATETVLNHSFARP